MAGSGEGRDEREPPVGTEQELLHDYLSGQQGFGELPLPLTEEVRAGDYRKWAARYVHFCAAVTAGEVGGLVALCCKAKRWELDWMNTTPLATMGVL